MEEVNIVQLTQNPMNPIFLMSTLVLEAWGQAMILALRSFLQKECFSMILEDPVA